MTWLHHRPTHRPDEIAAESELDELRARVVEGLAGQLSEQEIAVLRVRFVAVPKTRPPRSAVARELGWTSSRIKQLERLAHNELKRLGERR